tara:strand:- start:2814 stop:4271 length:1458 start_codon:yes stop_codon:yes gene_type:complete
MDNQYLKEDHFLSDYILQGADLEQVKEKEEELNDQQKDAWKNVYAFAHQLNQIGRKWAKQDILHLCEQYYLAVDKVELAFKKVFDENKDQFGIADKPEIEKVEVWLNRRWEFVENEVTQVTEFREKEKEGSKWELLNVDTIYRKTQKAGFKFTVDKLKSLLRSDFVYRYNPFKDYFEALPEWNEEKDPDYIQQLASYMKVEDQAFFEAQFKKCLVRCIGCSLYGKENRIVFVLVGEKQNTGKSTYLRYLNPFGSKYYTEAPLHHNKDSSFAIAENFIYNLEELASLSNIDVNRLKSIISTSVIKERKNYAVNPVEQPRRANFFGSTNKTEFLTDTENTRWLCFNMQAVDWGYKQKVDIDLVWAQAFALYNSPTFSDQLTKEESTARDTKNKDYEINDYEKELIKRHFQIADASKGEFYTNADILDVLNEGGAKRLESRYIGKNMVQLGFEKAIKKINGHTARGYYAKRILGAYSGYISSTEDKPF